jgi:hypothetical protein
MSSSHCLVRISDALPVLPTETFRAYPPSIFRCATIASFLILFYKNFGDVTISVDGMHASLNYRLVQRTRDVYNVY